jgi:hypothetical protein
MQHKIKSICFATVLFSYLKWLSTCATLGKREKDGKALGNTVASHTTRRNHQRLALLINLNDKKLSNTLK